MYRMIGVLFVFLQCFNIIYGRGVLSSKLLFKDHHRQRRDTVAAENRKWPGGVVPYVFGYSSGYLEKKVFNEAKAEIEKVSCVRFVKRTSEKDYVRVISSSDGCYSIIGRVGGRQDLSLGDGCHTKGIAMHETLHTLGFYHEQARRDRDKYISVNTHNAIEGARRQFDKYKAGEAETHGEVYDPDSIMHYSNKAFSKNGRNTIVYRFDPSKRLGQRKRMSEIDIRQLNKLYRCQERKKNYNKTTTSPNIDTCRDNPWTGYQCFFQSLAGSCYFYSERMAYLCPKTCGFCQPTCYDTSNYCNYFAYYGYCRRSETVKKQCRKTCKICKMG